MENSLKCVPPWRRGRPKAGIDCLEEAEYGRTVISYTLLTARWTVPLRGTLSCAFGTALLQRSAPLEGWRYSHIVSGIQVPRHVYSEFAFSAIVISSEAEKSLSVFIYLTYFPRETLNPSQQKSDVK